MTTDETRPLYTELGLDDGADTPTTAAPSATAPAGEPAPTTAFAPLAHDAGRTHLASHPLPPPVVYRRGPAPFAVLLGVVGLVVALGVLAVEVGDVSVPWRDLGPWAVVGGGVLVVLLGLLGLRASRPQE